MYFKLTRPSKQLNRTLTSENTYTKTTLGIDTKPKPRPTDPVCTDSISTVDKKKCI